MTHRTLYAVRRFRDYIAGKSKDCGYVMWSDGTATDWHAQGCMGIHGHVEREW